MKWLVLVLLIVGCDEGDVSVNNNLPAPADSTCDSVMTVPCDPETVWAQMPCPPDTVWITDPFWDCIKECERVTKNRNSKLYRRCVEDCLGEIE